ncbi:hypothetical protein [Moraxella boevrei]|uniref:hypothetical protein n=1 Tax=Faucicola boevrei TaxID=346665 RepID=UPI003736DF17
MNIPSGNNPFLTQIILSYLAVSEARPDTLDVLAKQVVDLIIQAFPNELKSSDVFNLPYKDITDVIFSSNESLLLSDSIYNFRANIEIAISQTYSLDNPNQHHNTKKKYIKRFMYVHDKLVEHTLLAQAQRLHIERVVRQAERIAKNADEIANQAKETAQKAEETYKSMFANYVTILGIFTAIIVTIFGGLNVINVALKQENFNPNQAVFLTVMAFMCVVSLLYFLANMIAFMKDEKNNRLNYIFGAIVVIFAIIMCALGATL